VILGTYIVKDDVGQPDELRREIQTAYPVEISWIPLKELIVPRAESSKTRRASPVRSLPFLIQPDVRNENLIFLDLKDQSEQSAARSRGLTMSNICVSVKPNLTGTGRLALRTGRTLFE
jgi:hypothetical protein